MKTLYSILAVSALTLASCGGGNSNALQVKAAKPIEQSLQRTVEVSGVLAPDQTASVFAKLTGQAAKVTVDVGSRVKAGQVLLEIDAHELAAQLALAQASVATVRQQAAQALVGIDTAQTNYDQAKRYLDRINSLKDQSALSSNQLDDAKAKVDLTKRALDSAKLQYKTLSEASLEQAEAQVNVVKSQIDNSVLESPIDGIVTNRNINPGELTSPSSSLFSIAKIDQLKLQGTVGQEVVGLLNPGEPATVYVDGLVEGPITGKITQIGPVAASSGQYFPVVVTLNHPGKALAGMTARATFQVNAPSALTVPQTAVTIDQGIAWLYVIDGQTAHRTEVGLGLSDGRTVQVLRGLSATALVAVTNVSLLTDNAAVQVLP